MVDTLPPLREVIAQYDLQARKSLGQNFLLDLNLTGRIARAGGRLDEGTIIEVGPGPGGLTRALLSEGAERLVVIEADPRTRPILDAIAAHWPGRLTIIEADALTIDLASLGPAPRKIIANLPYNVATPLLLQWLRHAAAFAKIVVMLQKEMVDRLAAAPHSKDYGRLSVMVQWLCIVEPQFEVNRAAFIPPPKVTSTVVALTPRPTPLTDRHGRVPGFAVLEAVVAAAFGQRRKMLRSALKNYAATFEISAEALCERAGIDPTQRAETLSVMDFCTLATLVEDLSQQAVGKLDQADLAMPPPSLDV